MLEQPENINAHVAKRIDEMKRLITPFYFDHESSDSQLGPYSWFEDVKLAYENILAGNDMQKTRSLLTGLSTSMKDVTDFGGVTTNVIEVKELRPQKYRDLDSAMHYLNYTSCFNLAICHQIRMKVCMQMTEKNDNIILFSFV